MMFSVHALTLCLWAPLARISKAEGFLQTKTEISASAVESILLEDLFNDQTGKVRRVEEDMAPMFRALPKNEHGLLDPSTVRYALHRYFVHKHGWYMKGIDPSGKAWNSSSAATVMKERAPEYIQGVFAKRLNVQGMNSHELAAFATTLLDLVHQESVGGLEKAFKALNYPLDGSVPRHQSEKAVKAWMMNLIMDSDIWPTAEEYAETERNVVKVYPTWDDTYLWVKDTTTAFYGNREGNPFMGQHSSFVEAAALVEDLGHRWGAFQNLECYVLKNKLTELEDGGTGRVPLGRFYAPGEDGKVSWFTESVQYLRNLGVLDEDDPKRPSVVITNYLTSQTNCLSSSGFYSTCCSDECEPLLVQVEKAVAAPTALPESIARVISQTSSHTVDAPRNLSSILLNRLNDIASMHGGRVPLHGRMFSQWMHHVYPRECPFPHVTGTVNPMNPWEFIEAHGVEALDATAEERASHHTTFKKEDAERTPETLPWNTVEELVATAHSPKTSVFKFGSLRGVMAFLALFSFLIPMFKATKNAVDAKSSKFEKHLV